MNHWVLKTEPTEYGFDQLRTDKKTVWSGIRNPQAQKNLRSMTKGDLCFIFHTGKERAVVGLAKVMKPAFPDPTAGDEKISAIEIGYVKPLKLAVPLAELKATSSLKNTGLVRQGRLSVSALSDDEFNVILAASKTTL